MRRPLLMIALVALGAGFATTIHATRVQVPSQQSTIAAALATSADTVLVAAGDFHEDVQIGRSVVLIGSGDTRVSRIRTTSGASSGTVVVASMRSDHEIRLASGDVTASNCWADSTLTCTALFAASVSSCKVFGAASVLGFTATVSNCRVFGGGLLADGEGTSVVSGNYIEGPAAVGLTVGDDTYPSNNIVRNCTVGIQAGCAIFQAVSNNVVLDCTSTGIQAPAGNPCNGGTYYTDNLVMRCGGDGINARGAGVHVQMNRVQQVSGTGIVVNGATQNINDNEVRDAGGDGIRATSLVDGFLRNRAIRCGLNGFNITGGGHLRSNVSGNNHADGFHVDTQGAHLLLQSNTSYLNTGDAYDVTSNAAMPDTVDHNIGFTSAYGLRWTLAGGAGPYRSCDDWYGNTLGATSGVTVAPNDLLANPLLCDPLHDIVSLAASSPVLNAPGCGLIGAVGAGCVSVVAADGPTGMEAPSLRAFPLPTAGGMRFSWPRQPGTVRLQVLDAAGALRWAKDVSGITGGYAWNGVDEHGRALPPGVYFTRLVHGDHVLTGRAVIAR